MPRKVFLDPIFKDKTRTDLVRIFKIHLRNVEELQQKLRGQEIARNCLRKEINFRDNPEAQETYKAVKKLEKILEDHNSGKKSLSITRFQTVMKALELNKKSLDALLSMGVHIR